MRTNKTKAKIAAGECVIGVSVAFPSPDLVELCAAVGFDCEHEPMYSEQIVHCIRAAESFDITRIPDIRRCSGMASWRPPEHPSASPICCMRR